ncbi:CAF17-like 4Fe-4S cluster assembly/insertion protein YgfZ [Corynebacterium sp. H113]|uniref:CAF17-like 4Fe-4S cluster assembly/insertion protein YgfZ n=1 Tax=Corynebacterium sp. H113 TaxID=3133419 RepID=UPI00309E4363
MAIDFSSPIVSHLPGAVAVEGDDVGGRAGVAWHYGSPLVEQRAIHESTALVDRSYRTVIEITGEDRLTWLNTLFSQKLDDVSSGTVTEALNLDPQGRVLHHMVVTVLEDSVLLDVPPLSAESLLKYLTMMIFWSKVEVRETDLAVLSVVGPTSPETLAAAHLPFPQVGTASLAGADCAALGDDVAMIRHLPWPAGGTVDLLVPRSASVAVTDQLLAAGARPTGLMAWEAERVVSLRPEVGLDVDEKMIPHESPRWIASEFDPAAVHLEKGCYRGQETVSRVHNLGRPPRTLVMLQIDGSASELPETGDAVKSGKRTVGYVGTVVHHCDFGPIALALVKRSVQEGVALTVGECAVSVDPSTVDRDDAIRPGRAAVTRLRTGIDPTSDLRDTN